MLRVLSMSPKSLLLRKTERMKERKKIERKIEREKKQKNTVEGTRTFNFAKIFFVVS